MGNKLGRRRQVVDEKYTRPQGLYQHMDVDQKKLRKLILDSKLAPCYPGDDDSTKTFDLEECPICFLYYPSLNRSKCCMKGICTECYLQLKTLHSAHHSQCPFCKTSNYDVEYRGTRTKEEKGKEQIEEQKVIEAKIRMQIEERHEQEQNMQKRQAVHPSLSTIMIPTDVEYQNLSSSSMPDKHDNIFSFPASVQPSTHNRQDEFDIDLEEIMVMEAILLSMQDHGTCSRNDTTIGSDSCTGSDLSVSSSRNNCASRTVIPAEISSSSSDLAYTAATTTASQHVSQYPANSNGVTSSSFSMVSPNFSCFPTEDDRSLGDYTKENGRIEVSDGNSIGIAMAVNDHHRFEEAGAGTSYAGSENALHPGAAALPCLYAANIPSGHILHETFEEQMMLAMAVSLADTRTRMNSHGTWL